MKMSGWVVKDDHVRLRDATHIQIVHAAICERIGVPHVSDKLYINIGKLVYMKWKLI